MLGFALLPPAVEQLGLGAHALVRARFGKLLKCLQARHGAIGDEAIVDGSHKRGAVPLHIDLAGVILKTSRLDVGLIGGRWNSCDGKCRQRKKHQHELHSEHWSVPKKNC
jgi:hypothetical protein